MPAFGMTGDTGGVSGFGYGGGTPEQDATRQLIEAALQQTQQGPTFAEQSTNQLIQAIMGITAQPGIGQVTPGQTDIMRRTSELYQNPLGSGIFQSLLQPILAALAPSERAQRQSLTDRFRSAGQSGSGAFAQAARQQESDIFNQRGQVTSNLAMNSLQQLLGALQGGFQQQETGRQASLTPVDLLLRALGAVSPIGRENVASRNPLNALSRIAPIAQQTAQRSATSQLLNSGTPTYGSSSAYGSFGGLGGQSLGTPTPNLPPGTQFQAGYGDYIPGYGFGSITPITAPNASPGIQGYPASDPRSQWYDPTYGMNYTDPWVGYQPQVNPYEGVSIENLPQISDPYNEYY